MIRTQIDLKIEQEKCIRCGLCVNECQNRAIEMDPDNTKYRAAYGKMNAKNDYDKQSAYGERAQNQRTQQTSQNPYRPEPIDEGEQMGGNACSNCVSCCYTYLCVDCLFSLCCGCR